MVYCVMSFEKYMGATECETKLSSVVLLASVRQSIRHEKSRLESYPKNTKYLKNLAMWQSFESRLQAGDRSVADDIEGMFAPQRSQAFNVTQFVKDFPNSKICNLHSFCGLSKACSAEQRASNLELMKKEASVPRS